MDQPGLPTSKPDAHPVFVSLGMAVLDELHFPNGNTLHDVLGGSGMYSTLGARLFNPGDQSVSVGCIVIAGKDFPESVIERLQAWKMTLHVKRSQDEKSTRGRLEYEDDAFGKKNFSYMSGPLRPSPADIEHSNLLKAKTFHILASPTELEETINSLLSYRQEHGISGRPLLVWEPAPLTCGHALLDDHLQACKLVDFFSPNHLELIKLVAETKDQEPEFDKGLIEEYGTQFLNSGIGVDGKGTALIRCGEHGCLILSASVAEWLPPFYESRSSMIVDPTGAGNAFLGGFAAGYHKTGELREASIYGTVAASFALEQFGLPDFSPSSGGAETWNGTVAVNRLAEYKERLSKHQV